MNPISFRIKDWKKAFMATLPKRKGAETKSDDDVDEEKPSEESSGDSQIKNQSENSQD